MRSIITVTTPPSGPELIELDVVKLELGITDANQDDLLNLWIRQGSLTAAGYCQQVLVARTITETFRNSLGPMGDGYIPRFSCDSGGRSREALVLASTVVQSITSVSVDGVALPTDQYEHDELGLYRLNSSGYPMVWNFSKSIVVVYVSGFTLGVDVPDDLQRAVIMLIREARGTAAKVDPTLKVHETVGVARREWFVPSASDMQLPIEISGLLDPYRRNWAWMV